eukprot:1156039-Pelagomonas_calceolata.AAC.4
MHSQPLWGACVKRACRCDVEGFGFRMWIHGGMCISALNMPLSFDINHDFPTLDIDLSNFCEKFGSLYVGGIV